MALPHYKFTYFDGPGRGELTRLAFVASGIAFDDNRIDFYTYGDAERALQPLGKVPVLEFDGVKYPQSLALARYVGKLGGLYPADPLEALQVDVLIETLTEVRSFAADIRWRTTDEAVKAEKSKILLEETLPKYFGFVETYLKGPFLFGDKLTLADLIIFDICENSLKDDQPEFDLSQYAKIEILVNAVRANERVAAYLAR
jgi:prostaglandin-H2 D-isomerase / glutathione transferase